MVGCAAGEGHLDHADVTPCYQSRLLASAILTHARELKVSLIVLKEFRKIPRSTAMFFAMRIHSRTQSADD